MGADTVPRPTELTDGGDEEPVTVHLLLEDGPNRRLLADWLDPYYEVSRGALPKAREQALDLCIVDTASFSRDRQALADYRAGEEPVFFPVLLVVGQRSDLGADRTVWDDVDDVVEAPIRQAEFGARLTNLLDRRLTSKRLANRERDLRETVAELERKERAMDAAPIGITITDPGQADNPVVYANAAFERITGYDAERALGRNMRFLQGPATNDAAVEELRRGIDAEEPVSVTLLNYREDGTQFWNRVDVAPVHDESGALVNFVGFQTDVTEKTIREQRLSVLNRVMRHNTSNDLNVIQGYAENLHAALEDPDELAAVGEIERSAAKLAKLGRDVRRVERILERCRGVAPQVDIGGVLETVRDQFEDEYPDADLRLAIDGGPWFVASNCLDELFSELVENALRHANGGDPRVDISVRPTAESADLVEVHIVDDGPGIPDDLAQVYREGEVTQLKHSDGLGLWLAHWIVTLLGGDLTIESDDGTAVTIVLPTSSPEGEQ